MFKFGKKKEQKIQEYDRENLRPVIRCSICNGEQVAGFKNLRDGSFQEVMLIRNENDLNVFRERYGLDSVQKEY